MVDLEAKQQIKQNGDMMHYTILAQIFCCRTTQIIQDDCLSTKKASPATPASKEYHVASFCFPRILYMVKKSPTNLDKGFSPFLSCQKNIVFWEDFPYF